MSYYKTPEHDLEVKRREDRAKAWLKQERPASFEDLLSDAPQGDLTHYPLETVPVAALNLARLS